MGGVLLGLLLSSSLTCLSYFLLSPYFEDAEVAIYS